MVVVPPEPENVKIVDEYACVARFHDVVARHDLHARFARKLVLGVRDEDELLLGVLPHGRFKLFGRGVDVVQRNVFRGRTVEEFTASDDFDRQFVVVLRTVGRSVGYGVEAYQDRRVHADVRLVGRHQAGAVSVAVTEFDVSVFAVAVGRALLFGGIRFPAFVLLFCGPVADQRLSLGLQRAG